MIGLLSVFLTNKWVRQIGIYVGIAILLMLGLRWYSNKAYSDGRSEGVKAALSESITASEISWRSDINELQQKLAVAHQDALVGAQAARAASEKTEAIRSKSSQVISSIPQQVAQLPVEALSAAITGNDATVRPEDVTDLKKHLLESQLTNKELFDEVKSLDDSWKEYKRATDSQVAGLNDQLTATQGQLHVMTQERDAYKASFESATKKRGCGALKKLITLGICR